MLQLFQHMFLISPVYDTRHNLLSSPLHSDISSFNLYRVLWKTAHKKDTMKQSSLTTKTSLVQLRKLLKKSKQKTDRTQLDPFLALLYYSMNTTAAKCGLVNWRSNQVIVFCTPFTWSKICLLKTFMENYTKWLKHVTQHPLWTLLLYSRKVWNC